MLPVSQDSVAGGNVHTLVVTEAGEHKGTKLLLDPPKPSPANSFVIGIAVINTHTHPSPPTLSFRRREYMRFASYLRSRRLVNCLSVSLY